MPRTLGILFLCLCFGVGWTTGGSLTDQSEIAALKKENREQALKLESLDNAVGRLSNAIHEMRGTYEPVPTLGSISQ